jgi:hypothetical protein
MLLWRLFSLCCICSLAYQVVWGTGWSATIGRLLFSIVVISLWFAELMKTVAAWEKDEEEL